MNLYSIPMLVTGILCTLLAISTWLFRRRESINRIFSFFTLALAVDAFAFFLWFQFGSIETIHSWIRIIHTVGFLVPIGLILFFFAFTGYDKKLDAKILGIKVRHFRVSAIGIFVVCMILNPFTELIVKIGDTPKEVWDYEDGPVATALFPIFAGIFIYLLTMVIKSYRMADNKPHKRFILLLALGAVAWILIGYSAVLFIPTASALYQFISYLGIVMMAVIFFVAIVNYQSDKVHDLNINLERKVADRTRELKQKNLELEDTFNQLKQMQKQIVLQEKMATLGQLVAGLTHEINTPISAIQSMNATKSKAAAKLQEALENVKFKNDQGANKALTAISQADRLIDQGTERLNEIMNNLKNFARLDEADTAMGDIHEGIDSVLALLQHDLLKDIEVVREYGEMPPFVGNLRKLNQVFFNLLKNAAQAIAGKGRITITTGLQENKVQVAIRDTGKGIKPEELETIFDPGFTTKGSVVRSSLGLSICYQIIKEHQGEIKVASTPGEGSVFTVLLPI